MPTVERHTSRKPIEIIGLAVFLECFVMLICVHSCSFFFQLQNVGWLRCTLPELIMEVDGMPPWTIG